MGNLPANAFDQWLQHALIWPKVFVELGTFKGVTAALAAESFPVVHTVEASCVHHAEAVRRYGDLGIYFHLGDSRVILADLCASIQEPAVFYHDAHWWPYADVVEDFPLWDDLDQIARRPYPDVVVVDEAHRFGTGRPTHYWQEVTLESIAARFPGHQTAFLIGNQAVVVR